MGGLLNARTRLFGSTRTTSNFAAIRSNGIVPVSLDLLDRNRCRQLVALANRIVMLAPPPNSGSFDPHTTTIVQALAYHNGRYRRYQPSSCQLSSNITPNAAPRTSFCYISTTGVYGDRQGAWVDEQTPTNPQSDRAKRRVAAESVLRKAVMQRQIKLTVLRAPGIYAENRLPLERLKLGTPALISADDVFTNHIHAYDLTRLSIGAVLRARSKASGSRIYNTCDESDLKMADYFDLVAEHFNLPKPPRVSKKDLPSLVSPAMLSFMSESRRIRGQRIQSETKVRLRFRTVNDFLISSQANSKN